MKKLTKVIASIFMILGIAMISSCSKQEVPKTDQVDITTQIEDYDKLLRFISWSLELPTDSVKFDSNSKEFYVPNTVVREKLERVREEYNKANVYKSNFEQK